MSKTASEMLRIAAAEVGYKEKASNYQLDDKTANAGDGNWTKYARDLAEAKFFNGNKNGHDWCTTFVAWCAWVACGKNVEAGRKLLCQTGGLGAVCRYGVNYYKAAGRWFTEPQPGDQIFFVDLSDGIPCHTGIVESVVNGKVNTIEGNTSNAVLRRTYAINNARILGYGRPVYDGSSVVSRIETNVTSNKPEICKGSTGDYVKDAQKKLIALGYSCGPDGADGDFGTNTYKAVVAFQKDHDLTADGVVGDKTWAALDNATPKEIAIITPVKTPVARTEYVVGDIVYFVGNTHYTNANASTGRMCRGGKAKVTHVKQSGKHPYHLIAVKGGGSNVYGWVDTYTISGIAGE